MRIVILFFIATLLLGTGCASTDPAEQAKARKERAEEQRARAAKANVELQRKTK